MDVFSKFVQTKNTMIMRKVLLLLLCCISGVVMAETRKDIDLKKNDVEIRPLSIMSEPTAYQADAVITEMFLHRWSSRFPGSDPSIVYNVRYFPRRVLIPRGVCHGSYMFR